MKDLSRFLSENKEDKSQPEPLKMVKGSMTRSSSLHE